MSCETQLIEATYDRTNILNKVNGQIDVILLDFGKVFDGGGVDPIPCVSTHRISEPRSGPTHLLPPHVKQRSHPHGVRPQIPDR